MDPRLARLNEPHLMPLTKLVEDIRARGFTVPNFDPNDGGCNARSLFLLETPGPKAVSSSFVSRDNPDPSAKNVGEALDRAGLQRSEVLLWNVVPYCISTADRNGKTTAKQVRESIPDTQALIDRLPHLKAVIFCGEKAREAFWHLRLRNEVSPFGTSHTGAKAYNKLHLREDIHDKFLQVAQLLRQ
jgi:hypothetical protein